MKEIGELPVLPYAGTSGHQGDASLDAEPMRSKSQARVYLLVEASGVFGRTSLEIEHVTGLGHGVVSSALSCLHKDGLLVKLAQRRNRYGIYLIPALLSPGTPTVQHKANQSAPPQDQMRAIVVDMLYKIPTNSQWTSRTHYPTCWMVHAPCALQHALHRSMTDVRG